MLLQHLPEDSAFKLAVREYDWPLQAKATTGVWNELKALRGDLAGIPFKPILSPSAERERAEKLTAYRAMHDDIIAQLRGLKDG